MRNWLTGAVIIAILTLALASSPVAAENGSASSHLRTQNKVETVQQRVEDIKSTIASKAAELKLRLTNNQQQRREKLDSAKHAICTNRKNAITHHSQGAIDRATAAERRISSISTKLQTFVTNKSVTVTNYQSLLDISTAKKSAVDAAIADAKTSQVSFSCDSDGPKAQLQEFVTKMDVVRSALKDYRQSVRDLGQTIKTAWQAQHPTTTPTAEETN